MNAEFKNKLAAIPWQTRKTVDGDARKIPQALLELCSTDADVRKQAYWNLDNHVVVQSDLYESAYDVIPFLIELARERPPYGRDLIYDLLIELANGYAPDNISCTVASGERLPLRTACRMALSAASDVYHRDQFDSDLSIVSKAAELIRSLEQP